MTPEQWQRIEEILHDALELDAAARAELLDRACGGDVALRAEVESLLAEHERAAGLLDTPAPWLATEPPESVPETIGPYRVLRTLGRGGMGQVFLAEREAPSFRQLVAVKVMRRGLDTDDLIARFHNERQILARLEHPNIARLIDVGATDAGLPYLAMEYVDGEPILDSCDDAHATIAARLALFRTICDAVDYAHRNLVVHRDLKPGNILVTADGQPKLLDFGIAKMLDPREDAPLTRTNVRVLTPEYSAPEQLRGEAVTTACDVYALGVLLYQLLAGKHPHAVPGATRAELERKILETDPPPPSAAATGERDIAAARSLSPSQLVRRLSGDLDNVVMRALRKEPVERYPSALAMAEDIERHLHGLPVRARPATIRYRARKFVRRNRVTVAAAALLFLVLTGATGITLRQSQRIREESARVAQERDKALQVRGFLLEMFGATGPEQATGDTVTARQLLDRRAASLAGSDEEPELRAEMLDVLAEGYEKLGLLADAEPLARQALDIRRGLYPSGHADLVASLNLLGWLLHQRGRIDEAEPLLDEAVTVGRRVFPPTGHPRLARALNDLGIVRETRGRLDEAAELFRASLDMRRTVSGDDHLGIAITTSNLSVNLYQQGQIEDAIAQSKDALALLERALGPDHQRTILVQTNLASMQSRGGDHEAAAGQHRRILERARRIFGPRHPAVGRSLMMLANELGFLGRYDEAAPLLEEALAIHTLPGGRPEDEVAAMRVLGNVRSRQSRHHEALATFRKARDLVARTLGREHREYQLLTASMARANEALGNQEAAERLRREVDALAGRQRQ